MKKQLIDPKHFIDDNGSYKHGYYARNPSHELFFNFIFIQRMNGPIVIFSNGFEQYKLDQYQTVVSIFPDGKILVPRSRKTRQLQHDL